MKRFLLIGLIAILVPINVAFGSSDELILTAEPKSSIINEGVHPIITGKVTDGEGNPVSNLYVYAFFPSKTAEAMTSNDGKFTLNPFASYPAGEYSIDVYARSETVLSRMTVNFEIIEPENQDPSEWLSNSTSNPNGLILNMNDSILINSTSPLDSPYLQIMEAQKSNSQIKSENDDVNPVDILRKNSKLKLEQDLAANSREIQKEQNRDAFASFVSKLDSIVHAIFWSQFDFTQKRSDDAYQAKLDALGDGKTSLDAMKVYQQEASVSRTEVVDYMKQLNIEHGFTNSTVQDQFDENGKMPRTGGK
jgi:hypothetical protein